MINDAGATCKRWDILDNRMINSGSGNQAIELSNVSSVSVVGNRADTQQYGLQCTSPADELIIADNTFTGNAGSNPPVLFAGSMANLRKLRVRDNPGYSPWAGQVTTSGTWQQLTPPGLSGVTWYYKPFSLSGGFPVQFGATPNVFVTTHAEGYAASVTSVSATTFAGRVWIPSIIKPNDTFDVTVYWVAEAVD